MFSKLWTAVVSTVSPTTSSSNVSTSTPAGSPRSSSSVDGRKQKRTSSSQARAPVPPVSSEGAISSSVSTPSLSPAKPPCDTFGAHWGPLPKDVWGLIFDYFEIPTLKRTLFVNKGFSRMTADKFSRIRKTRPNLKQMRAGWTLRCTDDAAMCVFASGDLLLVQSKANGIVEAMKVDTSFKIVRRMEQVAALRGMKIRACSVLKDGRLVFVDHTNDKIVITDSEMRKEMFSFGPVHRPWGIEILPGNISLRPLLVSNVKKNAQTNNNNNNNDNNNNNNNDEDNNQNNNRISANRLLEEYIDGDEHLIVADSERNCITIYSLSTGHALHTFGSSGSAVGQLSFPNQMHIDTKRAVLTVVEMNNNRLQRFSLPDGIPIEVLTFPSSPLLCPCGIDIDAMGRYYVADCHHHRLVCYDFLGNMLHEWRTTALGDGKTLRGPYRVKMLMNGTLIVKDWDSYFGM